MNRLLETLNRCSYDFYFLVVDDFLDISLPGLHNFTSLSAAKLNITITEKNSGRLLAHPKVQEYISRRSRSSGRKPAIIPFKPAAKIDMICRKNNWTLAANPAALSRSLEDKVDFYRQASSLELPLLPSLIAPFSRQIYDQAGQKYGPVLVVQTRHGWAGNSSFLSYKYSDLESRIQEGAVAKFSPYLSGYSLINNCVLTGTGLIQSPPGLQYTGIKPLTDNPLSTVGRQWPSHSPPQIKKQVSDITHEFAKYLQKIGYRGFFGLDFLVSDGKVYLIECNPRLTASFAFYTAMEEKAGFTPMFYFHLAEFTGLDYASSGVTLEDRFDSPLLVGSEITRKDASGATVSKYHEFKTFSDSADVIDIPRSYIDKVL